MTLGLSGTRDEKTMQQPFCSVYANHQLSARILTTSKKPHKLQYNIFRTINRYEYVGKPRGHGHPVMAMLRKKKLWGDLHRSAVQLPAPSTDRTKMRNDVNATHVMQIQCDAYMYVCVCMYVNIYI